jgi:NAD(P)-dependent dehydrogenase (short-subunit alcohol dehydrogenase family)
MKGALITGASSGLGLGFAGALAGEGHQVVGVHRGLHAQREWSALVSSGAVSEVLGSVADEVTVRRAFDAFDALGQPSLVVNCAGTGIFRPAGEHSLVDIQEIFEGNLVGLILVCEEAFRRLRQKGGVIVNVLSTAALEARPQESVYTAAKWGARGYTNALRRASEGSALRVVSLVVGGMDTPFWGREAVPMEVPANPLSVNDVVQQVLAAVRGDRNGDEVVLRRSRDG